MSASSTNDAEAAGQADVDRCGETERARRATACGAAGFGADRAESCLPSFTTLRGRMAVDYYRVLGLCKDASSADIRRAYHDALLAVHPDKQHQLSSTARADDAPTIALVQEAFRVLSDPNRRAGYDSDIEMAVKRPGGPRPAQHVSLDEFEEEGTLWTYQCRCGGRFAIAEKDMEDGLHLLGCSSCSEVVSVGYEVAGEDS
jgi:diphthamide biosynthesis protein 4